MKPLVVLHGYQTGDDELTFLGRKEQIVLEAKGFAQSILRFVRLSNGSTTLSDIRKELGDLSDDEMAVIVETCLEQGIIRDSRQLFLGFHEDSENPMQFGNSLSPEEVQKLVENRPSISGAHPISLRRAEGKLASLLEKRESTTQMTNESVSMDILGGLLNSIYSYGENESVPSAGKLYPLDIYVAVCNDNQEVSRGLYHHDPERNLLYDSKATVTPDVVNRVLDSYQAETSAFVVFVVANLQRVAAKYANRGYRYALLEAGHAAQNAYLFCAEHGLGVCEYGGFQDRLAATFLSLDYPAQAVATVLLIGTKVPQNQRKTGPTLATIAWNLRELLVGDGKPLKWLGLRTIEHEGYTFPRVAMMAKYRSLIGGNLEDGHEDQVAFGASVSSDEASIKAMAEAFERYASGIVRVEKKAKASELPDSFLDPRLLTPFTDEQVSSLDLMLFDENKEWEWVAGKRWSTGETVWLPVDHAFYPLSSKGLGRKLCYRSTSNGVAAHFDPEIAQSKALLELIERDAISLAWYGKREVTKLPLEILGQDTAMRSRHWNQSGWQCDFLNLTIDSVPVVLVILSSAERYPSIVSGAAADFSFEKAAAKALDEAEAMLMMTLDEGRIDPPTPSEVISPMDHGRLYFRQENYHRIRWLIDSAEKTPEVRAPADIFKMFDPVIVDLTPEQPNCELKVYRLVSERLLPINFGFVNEHPGHSRFKVVGLSWKQDCPSFPHFFA